MTLQLVIIIGVVTLGLVYLLWAGMMLAHLFSPWPEDPLPSCHLAELLRFNPRILT